MKLELDLNELECELLKELSRHDDKGPLEEGWQSAAMYTLGEKIRDKLADGAIPVPDFTGVPSEYLEGELLRREPQGSAAILAFADRIVTKGTADTFRQIFDRLSERFDGICYHLDSLPDWPPDGLECMTLGPDADSLAAARRASGIYGNKK